MRRTVKVRPTLLAYLDAHLARGACDDLHRGVDVVRVEIGHFRLRDLAALVERELAHLLTVGLARAFLNTGRLLDEFGRGRRLEDERERSIFENGDDGRDDLPRLARRAFVVRLAELHDVDAVLAKRRTDGRRRRGLSGYALERHFRDDLLCHDLYLFNLIEFEFDRSLAAEDRDERAQAFLLRVDLVHGAGEIEERPGRDLDAIAALEVDHQLRRLDAHLLEDRLDFFFGQRQRLLAGARRADESRHTLRVAHDIPRRIGHLHLDEHVAGIDLLLDFAPLAVFELDLFVHRHEHSIDEVLHVHGLDAAFEIRLDLVLVTGVRVDDVPLPVRIYGSGCICAVRGERGGLGVVDVFDHGGYCDPNILEAMAEISDVQSATSTTKPTVNIVADTHSSLLGQVTRFISETMERTPACAFFQRRCASAERCSASFSFSLPLSPSTNFTMLP